MGIFGGEDKKPEEGETSANQVQPTAPAGGEAGASLTPPEKVEPPMPTAAPSGAVASISERLGGEAAGQVEKKPDAPEAATPPVFDLASLTADQLAQLKAMLNASPDRAPLKAANPTTRVRRYQGQFIVDFKDAFNSLMKDEVSQITTEVLQIPVKFLGSDKFVNIPYRDFMNADQVRCEVVGRRSEKGQIVEEGMVVQKETGRQVERIITTLTEWFTIKLPEGTEPATVEIEARIANA